MYRISIWLWLSLMRELKHLGQGRRESGAFLFTENTSNRISQFLPYTEFDPYAFDTGIIQFSAEGQIKLSEHCQKLGILVFGDVHTHPGRNTSQSVSDKRHPMINRKGHNALIVPNFALSKLQLFKGVGFYEYQGNYNWIEKRNLKFVLI